MRKKIKSLTTPSLFLICSSLVVLTSLFCLCFGALEFSFADVLAALFGSGDPQTQLIVQKLRLPRTVLAAASGALLATAGAITQGLFRNPLADPSLIGVSSGATAGASVVIVLLHGVGFGTGLGVGFNVSALSLISIGAVIGGALAVCLVYKIASSESGTSVTTMLLAGIGVTFIAASISSAMEFVASNEMLRHISLWRMGGFDNTNLERMSIGLSVLILVLAVVPRFYSALDAMLLGESEAGFLGFEVQRLKFMVVVVVALAVGVSVAMSGTIAFVGLVVPHIVRILIGPSHRQLIPLSACAGAILLLIADSFARSIIAPVELPVGLVTSCLGAPLFIALLRHRHHNLNQCDAP